jgi:glycosyltransferase involved in cell wall biosynthesis
LLTIHDIRRMHSEWGGLEHTVYRLALERALNAADHVITVSESMKAEIHGFFPDVPISVIYNGLNPKDFDEVTDDQMDVVRCKYAFSKDFVLAVGHFEKRKNYLRLVDAISLLKDRGRDVNLVIIGNDSGEGGAIRERIQAAKLCDQVKVLSGLTDIEVRCAYKLCNLFVFPSSYEGFGIPVLEAMAAKRPMVLSNIPVFTEITQRQGVYFAFDDVDGIAQAMESVLSSPSEQARLVAYGVERVSAFSFPTLARRLVQLYAELV